MVLVLKARRAARAGALKALDFATTRCAPACERFVDVLGLKTLFGIFMDRVKVKGAGAAEQEVEERSVSTLFNLFQVRPWMLRLNNASSLP